MHARNGELQIRWLRALFWGKGALLLVAAFLPRTLPGLWRQADTLGVSLRYWLRWTVEAWPSPWWKLLLPAVLQSGDAVGIQAMEFPALNLTFAPVWWLGPHFGEVGARAGLTLLVALLTWLGVRVWDRLPGMGDGRAQAFWLVPLASTAAGWWGKFVPDLLAAQLCFVGLGICLGATREKMRRRAGLAGAVLICLGMLIKPNVAVVLGMALFVPGGWRSWPLWVPGLAIAGLYYTAGIAWLVGFQDGASLFAVHPRNPWSALAEFWGRLPEVLHLMNMRLFFTYGAIPVLLAIFKSKRSFTIPLFVVVAQFVAVSALGGGHLFMHDYYFVGIAPLGCLIFWDVLNSLLERGSHLHHLLAWALILGVTLPQVEQSWIDLAPWVSGSDRFESRRREVSLWRECRSIKQSTPEIPWGRGVPFRSSKYPDPHLGLCFGEREQSERGEFGFFRKSEPVPTDCRPLEPSSGQVAVYRCSP